MLRLQLDHRGAVENRGARGGILRRMMIRVRESGDCEFPQFPRPVENKSQRDGIFAIQQIFVLAYIATINDAAGGGWSRLPQRSFIRRGLLCGRRAEPVQDCYCGTGRPGDLEWHPGLAPLLRFWQCYTDLAARRETRSDARDEPGKRR